jgi:hypothetical protein
MSFADMKFENFGLSSTTMSITVRDLISVLQLFFPGHMPLRDALMVLATLAFVFPILRLHQNQRRGYRQPLHTAWYKMIVALLFDAAEPQDDRNEVVWPTDDDKWQFARNITRDAEILHEFLGLSGNRSNGHLFPTPPIVLCTPHITCVFCGPDHSLRKRTKVQSIQLRTENYSRASGRLVVAHCVECKADYYPDKIIFQNDSGILVQCLEYSTEWLRISKNGIWAHRSIAIAQQHALVYFHAGWSNFTEWINQTTNDTKFFTYRQTKRLFIEHFGRRLLILHGHSTTFICPSNPTTDLLCACIRDTIGQNGGVILESLKHGCQSCTHLKQRRSDVVDVGASLSTNAGDVVGVPTPEQEQTGDQVLLCC